MMTFCRRSVHSFLGLSSINNNIADHNIDQKQPPKCYGGLQGLVTATGDIHRPPNVVESSSVKSSPSSSSSSSSSSSTSPSKKVDPREIGFFIDEDVDGLTSCTESLGFESSDERRVDDHNHSNNGNDEIELLCPKTTSFSSSSSSSSMLDWRRRRLERKREEEKKFPPPLSSLYQNGQPNFFLWPVRKDGSLELTEVRIDRPWVFHAYREDGRLKLHIVRDDIDGEDVKAEDYEEEDVVEDEEEEERVVSGGEWRFKGFKRCHQNLTVIKRIIINTTTTTITWWVRLSSLLCQEELEQDLCVRMFVSLFLFMVINRRDRQSLSCLGLDDLNLVRLIY